MDRAGGGRRAKLHRDVKQNVSFFFFFFEDALLSLSLSLLHFLQASRRKIFEKLSFFYLPPPFLFRFHPRDTRSNRPPVAFDSPSPLSLAHRESERKKQDESNAKARSKKSKAMSKRGPLPIRGLQHVSLCVEDVGASARFYSDVLGFTEIKRPSSFDFDGCW